MNTETAEIILKTAALIVLPLLAWVASSVFKNIKINEFGEDNKAKRHVLMKLIANLFIYLCLCLIVIAGIFKIFNEQVILLLFVSGLTGLGVKLVTDLKD